MKTRESIVRWVAGFLARHPVLLAVAALAYIVSPVDLVSEGVVGPVGYLDDLAVLILFVALRQWLKTIKSPASSRPKDYYDTTAS